MTGLINRIREAIIASKMNQTYFEHGEELMVLVPYAEWQVAMGNIAEFMHGQVFYKFLQSGPVSCDLTTLQYMGVTCRILRADTKEECIMITKPAPKLAPKAVAV